MTFLLIYIPHLNWDPKAYVVVLNLLQVTFYNINSGTHGINLNESRHKLIFGDYTDRRYSELL